MRLGTVEDTITERLKQAILKALPDAAVTVTGAGGHFSIEVVDRVFEGKSMLQSQRLVYSAIKDLMAGDQAPVHAIDSLKTRTP